MGDYTREGLIEWLRGTGKIYAKAADMLERDGRRITELKAQLADEWDKGFKAGVNETHAAQRHDGNSTFDLTPNPHRKGRE